MGEGLLQWSSGSSGMWRLFSDSETVNSSSSKCASLICLLDLESSCISSTFGPRDAAVRSWRNWTREKLVVAPCKWLRPDLVLSLPILMCDLAITAGGSGILTVPCEIDKQFQNA